MAQTMDTLHWRCECIFVIVSSPPLPPYVARMHKDLIVKTSQQQIGMKENSVAAITLAMCACLLQEFWNVLHAQDTKNFQCSVI